jgi:thiamine pyrophosphate-dependent acetolactate synthase large subunit-like protein
MSKRVADVLIETLQAAGVKRCYGIVGDTLNRIAHAIHESEIEWVHMRHEEAGAFAASAEGQFTGELVACAGSCGPGSLHFINGLYEANRNRAPVILIATQVVRQDIGFNSIQEVDFAEVYKDCSVYSAMELETAVRLKANLVHMVWIDGTYDMVATKEKLKYGRTSGIDFDPIDYIKYAEAFGATGLMINTPDDVAPIIKKAFDTPGPVIVGVDVDYRDNHQLFEMIKGDGIH